ncbi:16S rRNA (uracil(1498)-N(3))-methyltransferase [Amphibacillus jilinensis]|uniref:16S rRNA (uracil(1498)-N(3))-methyltransferase n=1 Tax=Amphibacillus jilinensis TaxID=1216008 RepID=UPI0002EF5525|nr:16S rRNA (uracil(1498)-N(3))-methyltransferase [Amphibacillus jilinensis]
MQRYFIEGQNWKNDQIIISGDDAHHIVNVMRMTINDQVICNRSDGRVALCEIIEITDVIKLSILEWLEQEVELPIKVTLVQGLPKGDKLDWIAQKATELGVHAIIPFQASRSIVKWDIKKREKKQQRLMKIVKEASEQAHRNQLPKVKELHDLKSLIQLSQHYDHKFVAYEETARQQITQKLNAFFKQILPGQSVIVIIGPEGGLTEHEIDTFYQNGFEPVRFGPRILRTETASLYMLSALSYYFEETE